jgi:hypothetical protein
MRNLVKYPVTEQEVLEVIEEEIAKHKGEVGGVQSMVLAAISTILNENRIFLKAVVRECEIESKISGIKDDRSKRNN